MIAARYSTSVDFLEVRQKSKYLYTMLRLHETHTSSFAKV